MLISPQGIIYCKSFSPHFPLHLIKNFNAAFVKSQGIVCECSAGGKPQNCLRVKHAFNGIKKPTPGWQHKHPADKILNSQHNELLVLH